MHKLCLFVLHFAFKQFNTILEEKNGQIQLIRSLIYENTNSRQTGVSYFTTEKNMNSRNTDSYSFIITLYKYFKHEQIDIGKGTYKIKNDSHDIHDLHDIQVL